jgi:hypothetical protein
MENLTTENYADMIAESIVNGQYKQACEQFERALADGCQAFSLAVDISGTGIGAEEIVKLLCSIIERKE